jgi:hypothetical protein
LKNYEYELINMKITSELTNITTTILLLTVQVLLMYEEFKTKQELKELEQILEV